MLISLLRKEHDCLDIFRESRSKRGLESFSRESARSSARRSEVLFDPVRGALSKARDIRASYSSAFCSLALSGIDPEASPPLTRIRAADLHVARNLFGIASGGRRRGWRRRKGRERKRWFCSIFLCGRLGQKRLLDGRNFWRERTVERVDGMMEWSGGVRCEGEEGRGPGSSGYRLRQGIQGAVLKQTLQRDPDWESRDVALARLVIVIGR